MWGVARARKHCQWFVSRVCAEAALRGRGLLCALKEHELDNLRGFVSSAGVGVSGWWVTEWEDGRVCNFELGHVTLVSGVRASLPATSQLWPVLHRAVATSVLRHLDMPLFFDTP